MFRTMLVAVLATGLLAMPGVRAQPGAGRDVAIPSAEKIVNFLQMQRVSYEKDLQTTPFKEVLEDLALRHGVIFVVNKVAIGDMAAALDTAKAEKLSVTKLDGMRFVTFLDVYFRSLPIENLTYLVRADHIEITTRDAAQQDIASISGGIGQNAYGTGIGRIRDIAHYVADILSHVFDMNCLNQAQLEANDFRLLKQAIDERMEEPSAQAGRP